MALTPTAIITQDPFTDHRFSNTFNRLTRIITGTKDVILPFDNYVFDVTINDSSTGVFITSGMFVKDDVMVQITDASSELDFTNTLNYVGSDSVFATYGTPIKFFILINYAYQRTLPSPEASFVIAKERAEFLNNRSKYIYLASATVDLVASDYLITNIAYTDTDELNGDAIIERPLYSYTPPYIDGGLIS